MSARGSLALGKKLLAETKRLIPVAWLAFIQPEDLSQLQETGSIELDRKRALDNFAANSKFIAQITDGTLEFDMISTKLVDRISSSRAKTLTIDIAELINDDGLAPGIDVLINAFAKRDPKQKFILPPQEVVNPATGDKVKIKGTKLKSTADIMYSICWITDRWLETADDEELKSMVTGYIWD